MDNYIVKKYVLYANTLFDMWELAVADDVYIRNGSGSNIGVQAYTTYQYCLYL